MATAMAFLVWAQYMGPTVFLTLYNVIFDTTLIKALRTDAPNADSGAIIVAGATGFRQVVGPDDLPGVLRAYASSIDKIFYLAAAAGCVAFGAAALMGWKDIRKKPAGGAAALDKREPEPEADVAAGSTEKASQAAQGEPKQNYSV